MTSTPPDTVKAWFATGSRPEVGRAIESVHREIAEASREIVVSPSPEQKAHQGIRLADPRSMRLASVPSRSFS